MESGEKSWRSSIEPAAEAGRKAWWAHGVWALVACGAFGFGMMRGGGERRADAADPGVAGVVVESGGESGTRPARGEVGEFAADRRASIGRRGAFGELLLSDEDIQALGEQLRTASGPVERRLAFSKLLEGLTAENALQVREQIEGFDGRSAEFREFHYAWGAKAGEEAVLFGADTEGDDMAPALAGWASADPGAAMAWLENLQMEGNEAFDPLLKERGLKEEDLKRHLMGGLVRGVAANDPDRASEIVHGLAADGERAAYGMMHGVVESALRVMGIEDAAGWAMSQKNDGLRRMAVARVADQMVKRNPDEAKAWAEELAGSDEGGDVIARVGAGMVRRSPGEAMGWLEGLPEGDGRRRGVHVAMREWTGRDPEKASAYLATMPSGASKDAAIGGLSLRLAWEDPQAAVAWAETIGRPEERTEVLVEVGRRWTRKDVRGAAAWAAESGLSEEMQLEVLRGHFEKDD